MSSNLRIMSHHIRAHKETNFRKRYAITNPNELFLNDSSKIVLDWKLDTTAHEIDKAFICHNFLLLFLTYPGKQYAVLFFIIISMFVMFVFCRFSEGDKISVATIIVHRGHLQTKASGEATGDRRRRCNRKLVFFATTSFRFNIINLKI